MFAYLSYIRLIGFRTPLTPHGVTLLSLGNGAPEIFEGLAAVRQGKVMLAIVTLFGSCMFESSVITAGILLGGGRLTINAYKFFRDAGICLVGLIVVLSYGLAGEVWVYTGVLLPIVYCIYVAIVLYSETRWKDPFAMTASLDFSKSNMKLPDNLTQPLNINSDDIDIVEAQDRPENVPPESQREGEVKNCKYYCVKALEIALFPLYLIRRVTIPLYEEATWNRYYASLTPLCGFMFTLYGTERKV